jgi:hypothetical protein
VVIGYGAVWTGGNLADQNFPGAIQIVDLDHARQHLWKIAALLHSQDLVAKKLDLLGCPWIGLPDQSILLTVTSP